MATKILSRKIHSNNKNNTCNHPKISCQLPVNHIVIAASTAISVVMLYAGPTIWTSIMIN